MLDAQPDADLVAAARGGDEESYGILVRRHWPAVLAAARRMLPEEDAADATQDAFVSGLRGIAGLRSEDRVLPWLVSIVRNRARRILRDRGLERERLPDHELVTAQLLADVGQQSDPGDLRQALNDLSPPDRSVVVLHYLVGLGVAEVGRVLAVPEGTIKSRLHRARHQLKEIIRDMTQSKEADAEARDVIAGMRGVINWERLSVDESLSAWRPPNGISRQDLQRTWKASGEAIVGTGGGDSPDLVIGEDGWNHFELSVLVTPISGSNAQIAFRLSSPGDCYLMDMLLGWQAMAISRIKNGRLTKLSVVNKVFEMGREYELLLAAREASITTYLDGKLMNQVTDETHLSGPLALRVWESTTSFRDPRIRLLH